MIPKNNLVKLRQTLTKDKKRIREKVTSQEQGKDIPQGIDKDDGDEVCNDKLPFHSSASRIFLSFVLTSKNIGFVR